jgi:hypothetical protein
MVKCRFANPELASSEEQPVSKRHVVRQGEHLTGISKQHGISPDKIWTLSENADLKRTREKRDVLFPGDVLQLPDVESGVESASTEATHRFRLKSPVLVLRLVLRDASDRPVAGKDCILTVGSETHELTTDDEGVLEQKIPEDAVDATLEIDGNDLTLEIGHLDPVTEQTGQKARLNNLGYNSGPVDCTCEAAFLSAVEEFQCDNDLHVDGIVGKNTRGKLVEVYGY